MTQTHIEGFNQSTQAGVSLSDVRARSPCRQHTGNRPQLLFRGEPIILLDDIVSGLNVSEKTVKRYRDSGKLEVYESIEGNIKFVLQSDLDRFLEQSFISSSHPEYRTVKRKS
ncbi:MAG: helix-turn-helix domain-containing protein [Bacteroides sp.]|nr:helix-turn-helix domain-containing protein [Bacteroides sp.]